MPAIALGGRLKDDDELLCEVPAVLMLVLAVDVDALETPLGFDEALELIDVPIS